MSATEYHCKQWPLHEAERQLCLGVHHQQLLMNLKTLNGIEIEEFSASMLTEERIKKLSTAKSVGIVELKSFR